MDLTQYGQPLRLVENNEEGKCVVFKDRMLPLDPLYTEARIQDTQSELTGNIQVFSKADKYLISVRTSTEGQQGVDQKRHDIDIFTAGTSHHGYIASLVDKSLTDTTFTRATSNITKTIDVKGNLVHTSMAVGLAPIKSPRVSREHASMIIPDPRFGTLDLETYMSGGKAKVYSIGFYTKRDGCKIFYINEGLDSTELVLRCLDAMIKPKYTGMTFYVHNLGHYDVVFILKILIRTNALLDEDKYKLEMMTKDDLILSLAIKMKRYRIKLVDSYNILTHSLRDLGKTYGLEVKKDIFPYSFVDESTIFYKGSKPEKSAYPEYVDQATYDVIPKMG